MRSNIVPASPEGSFLLVPAQVQVPNTIRVTEINATVISKYIVAFIFVTQSECIWHLGQIGKIQKEVSEFCIRHLETLLQIRIGLFICGMQEEAVLQQELQQSFPEELLSVAIAKDHFGGAFNLEKMNLMERVIVKKVSKVTTSVTSIAEDRIAAFAAAMV